MRIFIQDKPATTCRAGDYQSAPKRLVLGIWHNATVNESRKGTINNPERTCTWPGRDWLCQVSDTFTRSLQITNDGSSSAGE